MEPVQVYGTNWCGDTQQTRTHLNELGIDYNFIDIEEDAKAAAWVERQNDGKQKMPTVKVGGVVLSVPSDGELDVALKREGYLPRDA